MVQRFFAIPVFMLLVTLFSAAAPAFASDFTEHFVPSKSRAAVPPFIFEDGKGQTLDLKGFRGRYVLLNVWATWCGPCTKEMPALDALAAKMQGDAGPDTKAKAVTISSSGSFKDASAGAVGENGRLAIIALTEDHEGLAAAQNFYKKHNLHNLGVFVDTAGEAPNILQIRGLPTTLLIDPKGLEIGRIEGQTDWNDPATIAFLEAQMKP